MVLVIVFSIDVEHRVLPSDKIDADHDLEIVSEFIPGLLIEPVLIAQ